jgi:hypothetical protein
MVCGIGKSYRWCNWFAVAVVLLLSGAAAYSQQDTGGIIVAATDGSGAVVQGAKVELVNNGTNARLGGTTNDIGTWTANPLTVGDYKVTIVKSGFGTIHVDHVVVQLQQSTHVPVTLVVGSVSQEMVVTAQTPLLQTEEVSTGQTISGVLKDDLPVSGRNFNRLAVVTVGVNTSSPSGPRDSASGGFSANGVSQYQNNYVLDGTDNNSYDQNVNEGRTFAIEPSLDAIAEFKVLTNSYSAEFGRDGGAVINVITKSGTNKFHGSVYEYFQSSSLNTNDFFNNAQGIQKPQYHQNIYGASLGGPIWLPKLYNGHDKSFFFVDFEGQPYRSPGSVNKGVVPTAAEVAGNFSGGATIYDPTTGLPFQNNVIPTSRISPISAKIAAAIPAPNLTGGNNYYHNGPLSTDDNRIAGRIDQKLTSKDTIFGRYQYQHQSQPGVGLFAGSILSGDSNVTTAAQGVVASWVHLFSGNVVNEARFGWTRLNWLGVPVNVNQNINAQVGINGILPNPGLTGGLASINFTNGLNGFGGSNSEQDLNGVYQGEDTVTWIRGHHSIKLGASYRSVSFKSAASSFAPNGAFGFDGHYTAGAGSKGDPFADFLLDLPYQSQISEIHTNDYQRRATSFFAEDAYKLNPKLTINVGIRWDYTTPVWESQNHGGALNPVTGVLNLDHYQGAFDQATQNQIARGIITVNNNANRYFGVQPDYKDFGPRVGFSYLATPTIVFRAGYGLYYGPEQLGMYGEPSPGFSTPFLKQASYSPANASPTTSNPVTMAKGFPSTALTNPAAPTLYAMDPSLHTPYIAQWNATLQKQFTPETTLDISYIGSKSTGIYTTMDWNIPAIALNNNIPYANRQPFPSVDNSGNLIPGSAIQGPSNDGMGTYNGLGVKFQSNLSNSLSMISAYTWSHAIDDITNDGLSVGNNGRGNYPWNQLKGQRGNSDWDMRNRFISAFQYQLPYGRGKKFGSNVGRVTDAFLGGWRLGGIVHLESGAWYTVNQNYDSANNGSGSFCGTCRQRPDNVSGQNANAGPRKVDPNNNGVHWFNVNAFTIAANGTVGNVARNSVLGPSYRDLDASLSKVVSFHDGMSLQLRLESFNLTNTTNFLVTSQSTSPKGFSLGNKNFGDLTADRGGRTVQIAGRFVF